MTQNFSSKLRDRTKSTDKYIEVNNLNQCKNYVKKPLNYSSSDDVVSVRRVGVKEHTPKY